MKVNVQELLARAQALKNEALEIIGNDESSAEDLVRADGLLTDAQQKADRAIKMSKLQESLGQHIEGLEETEIERYERKVDEDYREAPGFKDWGYFLEAVLAAQHRHIDVPGLKWWEDREDAATDGRESKYLSEGVGAAGGFLVPIEFMNEVMSVMGESALVRPRASVIRMRRRQLALPVLDQTGTTAGVPHWFGGMQFYWTAEGAEKTASDASWREVMLTAHKLVGLTRSTDELLDDAAISLNDFFQGPLGFAGGLAWMEDYAFLRGNGVGQPLGVLNAGATITVNRAAAGTIGYVDLLNMLESFLPSGRGIWIATHSAMAELAQINGPAGNPSYVWLTDASGGIPGMLLGMPIVFTEKLPLIGTSGDIMLADWSYYLLGDRQRTTITSTIFEAFVEDKTTWRAVHRVAGRPWLSAPLTLQDGTTQISPFVILGDYQS